MTDLEKAIEWLEYVKQMKEANLRSYPHRTQDAEAVEHCTVLLDALRWIPVSERLPTEGQGVLFECICDMQVSDLYGMYKGVYEDGSFWIDNEDHDPQCGAIPESVIHWMPLPKPPESEVKHDG
jgi:hypothetical protein